MRSQRLVHRGPGPEHGVREVPRNTEAGSSAVRPGQTPGTGARPACRLPHLCRGSWREVWAQEREQGFPKVAVGTQGPGSPPSRTWTGHQLCWGVAPLSRGTPERVGEPAGPSEETGGVGEAPRPHPLGSVVPPPDGDGQKVRECSGRTSEPPTRPRRRPGRPGKTPERCSSSETEACRKSGAENWKRGSSFCIKMSVIRRPRP